MNVFETAARGKFRFSSIRGELTAEQLFDLPLQSRSGLDLDTIAKGLNAELKQTGEESFVETVSPKKGELEHKLDLVKYIIKCKLDENEAKRNELKRKQDIEKLEDLLERKKDQALAEMPVEDIEKKLAELRS